MKTIGSPNKPAFNRNNSSKSASSRNNNSRPVSKKNNGDSEVNRFDISENNVEYAKKSRKLFKSGKLKSKKMFKSQNLAKSRKKLLKSENLTNFNAMKDRPKFLTLDARTAFNHLWLIFIEAPIFRHFDLKYHIWIETDALGFAINEVLS